jgi:hypothetical protein
MVGLGDPADSGVVLATAPINNAAAAERTGYRALKQLQTMRRLEAQAARDPARRNETAHERDRSSPAMKMLRHRLCPGRSKETTQVIENRLRALHFRKNPIPGRRKHPTTKRTQFGPEPERQLEDTQRTSPPGANESNPPNLARRAAENPRTTKRTQFRPGRPKRPTTKRDRPTTSLSRSGRMEL